MHSKRDYDFLLFFACCVLWNVYCLFGCYDDFVTLHTNLPRRSFLLACPIALRDTRILNFVYTHKKSRPMAFPSPIFTNL
jgi:hypothetical protein